MELIIGLNGWRRPSTDIMASNIRYPLLKKSYNPSEKVRKSSGDLDETEKALVTTTDTIVKEGNADMVDEKRNTKPNVIREAINPPNSEKGILAQ